MTGPGPKTNVVGVRFMPLEPVRFVAPGDDDVRPGDRVLVESESGPREAVVAIAPFQVLYSDLREPLAGAVVRRLLRADDESPAGC